MSSISAPTISSARFTIELEFVLCLSNPQYLQYLAETHPHLVTSSRTTDEADSDADKFQRYLQYLYEYWRTPAYSKYLTHPGAVLRNLELLQHEQFRKDMIRPDVIARLFEAKDQHEAAEAGTTAVIVE